MLLNRKLLNSRQNFMTSSVTNFLHINDAKRGKNITEPGRITPVGGKVEEKDILSR